MMKTNIWIAMLLLVALSGVVSSTNGAALQVTSHTTIPDTVYPGTASQLQITILNAGTDPAAGTVVNYKTPAMNSFSQISVGDIGAGSSAVASIPFNVPSNVSSGYFVIDLDIAYFGDSTSTTVKDTPVSIPVIVSQHQILQVQTI